jgi:hypothetical protein
VQGPTESRRAREKVEPERVGMKDMWEQLLHKGGADRRLAVDSYSPDAKVARILIARCNTNPINLTKGQRLPTKSQRRRSAMNHPLRRGNGVRLRQRTHYGRSRQSIGGRRDH